ncbi:MAG: 3-deoxy-manno-octulosonate cytidylyltransferase [Pseudomonadota bacterium]
MSDTLVMIPARMASTRLPDKPLAMIGDAPMIVHVMARAREAAVGDVIVATDDERIVKAVEAAGGRAQMTGAHHTSGSDRIHEAMLACDPDARAQVIVNLQGDLPTLEPRLISACVAGLADAEVDIATLVCPITQASERDNPNVVKCVGTPRGDARLRALYFTRATAPSGEGPLYHHIGIYAYRRSALDAFVALSPSPLERRERLEQLRALEHGMRIDAMIVDTVPLGVDTAGDLARARAALE